MKDILAFVILLVLAAAFSPPIDAPHAGTGPFQGTRPSTNNSSGEVTGWYINSDNNGNNVYHGFVWQPTVTQ